MLSGHEFVISFHKGISCIFLVITLTAIQIAFIGNQSVVLHELSALQNHFLRCQHALVKNALIFRQFGGIQLADQFALHFVGLCSSSVGVVSFLFNFPFVYIGGVELGCFPLFLNVIYLKGLKLGFALNLLALFLLIFLLLGFFLFLLYFEAH